MKAIERVGIRTLRKSGKDCGFPATLRAIVAKARDMNKKGNVSLTFSTSSGEFSAGCFEKGKATTFEIEKLVQEYALIDTGPDGSVRLRGAILRTT